MAPSAEIACLPPAALYACCALFEDSLAYRVRHGVGYDSYDPPTVAADLAAGRLFGLTLEGRLAQIFALFEADPLIWGAREDGRALYLHRVVTADWARGRHLLATTLGWVEAEARQRGRAVLRLDTWREATGLQAYYARLGFVRVGEVVTGDDPALSPQNRNLAVTLMEKALT